MGQREIESVLLDAATVRQGVAELAARFDGEIPSLVVTRPSLEDTYLRLIGEQPS